MTHPEADPLPGDFDEDLRELRPADVQVVEASATVASRSGGA
jgi:hypothetical protein